MNMLVVLMKLFTVQMKRLLMERTALIVMSLVFFPLGVMADDNEVLADSASSPLSYIVLFIIMLILTFGTKPVSAMQTDEDGDEDFDYFVHTGSSGKDKVTGTASTTENVTCEYCGKGFANERGCTTHISRGCEQKTIIDATDIIREVGTNVFVDYMMQIYAFAPQDNQPTDIAKFLVAVKAGNVETTMPQLKKPKHSFLGVLNKSKDLYLMRQEQNEAFDEAIEAQQATEEAGLERHNALPYDALGQCPPRDSGQPPNKRSKNVRASKPALSPSEVAAEIRAANAIAAETPDFYSVDPLSDPLLESARGTTLGSAQLRNYTEVNQRVNHAYDVRGYRALVPYDMASQSSTSWTDQSYTTSSEQSYVCSAGPRTSSYSSSSDSSPPTSQSSTVSFGVGGGGGRLPNTTSLGNASYSFSSDSSPPASQTSSASFAVGGGDGGLPNTNCLGNVAVALPLGQYQTSYVKVQLDGNAKFGQLTYLEYNDDDWVDQMKAQFPLKTKPLGHRKTKECLICGGLNFESKPECTNNGCWAKDVNKNILNKLTETSMTHTEARKKVS